MLRSNPHRAFLVRGLLALGLLLVSTTPLAGPLVLTPPTDAEALTKNLLYAGIGGLVVLPAVLRDPPAVPTTYDRLLVSRENANAGRLRWLAATTGRLLRGFTAYVKTALVLVVLAALLVPGGATG